ncbi:MAG: FAD-binding protein [Oscillochloris sp.]|nr:FAD-binding protein [Oscillochloris sp.]
MSPPASTTAVAALAARLRSLLGSRAVVDSVDALRTYDADASMIVSHAPQLVVLPADEHQAATVVQLAAEADLPVVARGAGTGIAGGAIPLHGGIVIATSRMEQVLSIEPRSRRALVQPGLVNAELNARLAPLRMQFAPDPSSQRASTIGGNLATNAGGPHCLKYGVTSNHILAVELVLHDGSLLWTSDGIADAAGYDITGLVVGSEGTFGVVTRVLVRLTPLPEANRVVLALFPSVIAASAAVSAVIAAGSLPTALEVMDHNAIRAVNSAYGIGLPEANGTTLLIIEVDGVADGLDDQLEQILELCRQHKAFELRPARDPAEQARVWAARKSVAGAIGRLAPAYYLIDTVVPRTRLPQMMEHVEQLRVEYGLEICNVFHAGDGNLHPLVLYDPRDPDQSRRAHAIAQGVLDLSIRQGGVVSGEHGIGVEKQDYLPLLFSPEELQIQAAVATIFNPGERFNPAKIFPADQPPAALAASRRARLANLIVRDSAATLADTIRAIVGDTYLLRDEQTAPYARGAARLDLVVQPAGLEELAATVAACARAGAAIVPWGGGTHQSLGCPPGHSANPVVALHMARLNAVHTYEPDDLTIGVGAGMTLADLQTTLAANRQMLPCDLADPQRATVGGMLASAAAGPRRLG